MKYSDLFFSLKPGFFERESIRSLPEEEVFSEQVLFLNSFSSDAVPIACPEEITFGMAPDDSLPDIQEAVRQVDEGWVKYFTDPRRVFCAFDGKKIVSFCILDDMGRHLGLHVGGPGCVGTVPAYRKRGIGLKMIQKATEILKQTGFDLSYIHYTHVDFWYAKLGYETVLRWNRHGIVWEKQA